MELTKNNELALSSNDVIEIAGISYRQLDYWSRNGFVKPSIGVPSGSGTARRWSLNDLRIVRLLSYFSGQGAKTLGTMAKILRDHSHLLDKGWMVIGPEPEWNVHIVETHDELIEAIDTNRYSHVISLVAFGEIELSRQKEMAVA